MSEQLTELGLISIVVPFHNESRYLGDCLESIRKQTFINYECLLIDNGAIASARKVAESYCQVDKRFKIVDAFGVNLPAALNVGLKHAKGSIIARMDSDDLMSADRIELQANEFVKDPDLVICGGNVVRFGDVDDTIHYPSGDLSLKTSLLFHCALSHPSLMFKKGGIGKSLPGDCKYNENYLHAEDYDFYLRYLTLGEYRNIPHIVTRYRVHADQLTQNEIHENFVYSKAARFEFIRSSGGSYQLAKLQNLILDGFPISGAIRKHQIMRLAEIVYRVTYCKYDRQQINDVVASKLHDHALPINLVNITKYCHRVLHRLMKP